MFFEFMEHNNDEGKGNWAYYPENEDEEQIKKRLIVCIKRRESVANISLLLIIANTLLIPCALFFEESHNTAFREIYALCTLDALFVLGVFLQKRKWEKTDYASGWAAYKNQAE